jgi:flagellar capping protein FliD
MPIKRKKINCDVEIHLHGQYALGAKKLGITMTELIKRAVESYLEKELTINKFSLEMEIAQLKTKLEYKEELLKLQE